MGGLKVYGGAFAASVALLAGAAILPATSWIFRTAYWIGWTGPVDYGSSLDARLLETGDAPVEMSAGSTGYLKRGRQVTDLALQAGSPGQLSIAIRKVGQGTTFSTGDTKFISPKTDLARMQIELSNAGAKLEPDNSFWPMMESIGWHILGKSDRANALFRQATMCGQYNDHVFYEAETRARLLEQVRGNLGTRQEVEAFASVMLPHLASFKSVCRTYIGDRGLKESAEERADVCRFALVLSKNTESYIGLLVGVSLASVALLEPGTQSPQSSRLAEKARIYSMDQINREAPQHAAVFAEALRLRELRTQLNLDRKGEEDWSITEDMRPQAAAALLGFSIFLVPLAFLIGRRLASLREKGNAWSRCLPFVGSLVGVFAGAAGDAGGSNNAMTVTLLSGAITSMMAAGISLLLPQRRWQFMLAGLHALVMIVLVQEVTPTSLFGGIGYLLAAGLPFLALASQGRSWLEQTLAWVGWIVWAGSLAACCVNLHGQSHSVFQSTEPGAFEPLLERMFWISLCAGLGAAGAGSLTPEGAKGHWVRACVVQGLMVTALVLTIGFNVRLNKTLAQLIPHEKEQVAGYQAKITVPHEIRPDQGSRPKP